MSLLLSSFGIGHSSEAYLQEKYVNNHSQFIEVDGLKVHCRIEGPENNTQQNGKPAPAIVLLHGVLSSLHTWDDWTQELKQNYTVYRVDMPGFGLSELPEGVDLYELDTAMDFLNKLMAAFGLEKFHIVGNSLGGYLSWNYAQRNPQQVESLAVLNPVCYPQKLPLQIALGSNFLVNPFVNFIVPRIVFSQSIREVYGSSKRLKPGVVQRYFDLTMRKGNKRTMAYIFRVFKREAKKLDLGAKISQIKQPTLVIWGSRDRWVPPKFAQQWLNDVPHAELKMYDGVGHVPMEEVPEITVADYSEFIQRHPIT